MEDPDKTETKTPSDAASPDASGEVAPPTVETKPTTQPHSVTLDARLHEAEAALVNAATHVTVARETIAFLHRLIDDVVQGVQGAEHRLQAAYRHVFGQPA